VSASSFQYFVREIIQQRGTISQTLSQSGLCRSNPAYCVILTKSDRIFHLSVKTTDRVAEKFLFCIFPAVYTLRRVLVCHRLMISTVYAGLVRSCIVSFALQDERSAGIGGTSYLASHVQISSASRASLY